MVWNFGVLGRPMGLPGSIEQSSNGIQTSESVSVGFPRATLQEIEMSLARLAS